jgi:ankyrin repeat protein
VKVRQTVLALLFGMGVLSAHAGVYEDILKGASNNETALVINLLQRGMDVNTVDPQGTSLLMYAARFGNVELLEFLLKNRASVLKKNRYGDTALLLAALGGHLEAVRRLVSAGAPLDQPGWTPLIYASFQGHADVIQFLADQGADVDAQADNGMTALMIAARNGHKEVASVLLAAGADPDIVDQQDQSALDIAQKSGNTQIVDLLRQAGAVED